jgi:hypothetical protein
VVRPLRVQKENRRKRKEKKRKRKKARKKGAYEREGQMS